jgi:hypothetical protein
MKNENFQELTIVATKLWQSWGHKKKSCKILISQMRDYKLQKSPYNTEFSELESPVNWWMTIFDGGNQLSRLAIKLFGIPPHSASCERQFSTLGWFFGKRRQRMNLETVESLGKVHRYILTNTEKELKYISKQYSEEEIKQLVYLATNNDDQYENEELDINENDLNDLLEDEDNNEESFLDIESVTNLEPWIVIDSSYIPQITVMDSDNENESDFNIEDLVINELNK